jgi:hypothetical protein
VIQTQAEAPANRQGFPTTSRRLLRGGAGRGEDCQGEVVDSYIAYFVLCSIHVVEGI